MCLSVVWYANFPEIPESKFRNCEMSIFMKSANHRDFRYLDAAMDGVVSPLGLDLDVERGVRKVVINVCCTNFSSQMDDETSNYREDMFRTCL